MFTKLGKEVVDIQAEENRPQTRALWDSNLGDGVSTAVSSHSNLEGSFSEVGTENVDGFSSHPVITELVEKNIPIDFIKGFGEINSNAGNVLALVDGAINGAKDSFQSGDGASTRDEPVMAVR